MFKWIKHRKGCNCHPIPEGCLKYTLNVGDLYGGEVSYDPNKWNWEASYQVLGKEVSGQAGGTLTRDECMEFIEERILEALSQLRNVVENPKREIRDILYQTNPKTGEFEQERLE